MPSQHAGKGKEGKLAKVPGTERTLRNGAKAAHFRKADGSKVFRIIGFPDKATAAAATAKARKIRSSPRKAITAAQAQKAFDRFYKGKGPLNRAGKPRYSRPAVAKAHDARTTRRVIKDVRYLRNPHTYDFRGVDTGKAKRKPLSPAQRAALAKGRAALKAKRAAARK